MGRLKKFGKRKPVFNGNITSEPEDVPVSNPVPQTVTTTSYENTNIIEEVRKGWKRKRTSVQEKNTDTMSAVCRQVDKYPAPHNPKEPDEHDLFCLSIAPKLRAMDKKQRILTEKIISDALYLGQMGYLNPAVHINIPSQNMSASPISTVQSQPSPSTTLIIKPEYEGQSDCDDDY
ncbi:uncharacterized protein [Periplaneta americana]|uniref:uncharacterized protein isoform X3 n=1 Tax=Periplaneta americana TaxID=6978 RepID=UPI0037E7DC98